MRLARGYTVLELLVASAIFLALSGAVLGLLVEGLAGAPILQEATDLHQRSRVLADVFAADLRAAAAGPPSGPLSRYFAAIAPRRASDPVGVVFTTAVTLRYVPPAAAHSRLVQPLERGLPVAIIDVNGCPSGTTACGFVAGSLAVIFDTAGHADFVNIDAIGPGVLTITDTRGPRAVTYPVGAEVADAVEVTYFFDAAARHVRREEGGGSFVVADNVTALTFDYLGDDMVAMPVALFGDGPFAGAGATMFDVDLLRVRRVRATLRLESGVDAMRGTDVRFFARPGTGRSPRVIHDMVTRVDVTLRNGPR